MRLSARAIAGLAITSLVSLALVVVVVMRLVNAQQLAGRVTASPLLGHTAPDFTIQVWNGTSGQQVRLSSLRGHPVVVNFYASWCTDCAEEQANLQAAYALNQRNGVMFIGVAYQDKQTDDVAFLHEYGVTYPSGPDIGGTAATDYGVTGVPETMIIDRNGIVVRHLYGPVDATTLENAIRAVVK